MFSRDLSLGPNTVRVLVVVLSITAGVELSCATGPFAHVGRPIVVKGVVVALTDENCRGRADPSRPQDGLLALDLTLQIRNTGLENATFDPDGLRLVSNGTAMAPIAATPVDTIRPGSGQRLDVHFAGEDPSACDKPMTLVLDQAMTEGAAPATGKSIAFVARPVGSARSQ
jgi:hypothetical protein